MKRSLTSGIVAAGLLLGGHVMAQPNAVSGSSTAGAGNPYTLEAGSQLEYQTSASLTGTDLPNGGDSSQFSVRFTVLAKGAEGVTVYSAVTPAKEEVTTGSQNDIGGRFTFQIQNDGTMGERTAGVPIPPFMGWSPALYFPPLPADEKSTISLPLPALQMELPVQATKTTKGGDVVVSYTLDKSVFGGEPGAEEQSPIGEFSGQYTFNPTEKSVSSSNSRLVVRQRNPQGKMISIQLQFEATRTAAKKLAGNEIEALRKDVTSAVRAFDEVKQSMSAQDQNTTAAVEALSRYLQDSPQGEFSRIFSEQKKAIENITSRAAKAAQIKEGVKAPDFSAKTLDGDELKLSGLRGKVVFLDFWATWCGPCVREIPHVKELHQKFGPKGLTIVGISGDRAEKDLRDFIKENEVGWKQIWQSPEDEGTILEQYGIDKFPTTVLLDREGTIRAMDLRGQELEQKIEELLGGAK